jgi:acetyl esterase
VEELPINAQQKPYPIDAAYLKFPRINITHNRLKLSLIKLAAKATRIGQRWDKDITTRQHKIVSGDSSLLPIIEIAPKTLNQNGANKTSPAIIFYHGGAFFMSYTAGHIKLAQRYACEAACKIFFVDYRLSPKHPFPAAHEDALAALEWVHNQAEQLAIDPKRILVMGDSAGGALAASCAQATLDRNTQRQNPIELMAQFLIYPVTDCRGQSASMAQFSDTPVWKSGDNKVMWELYLPTKPSQQSDSPPPYASPIHRPSFAGLPPAYIEVAQYDPLHDEGLAYAQALRADGVKVEVYQADAAVHGYEHIPCDTSKRHLEQRLIALKNLLQQQ